MTPCPLVLLRTVEGDPDLSSHDNAVCTSLITMLSVLIRSYIAWRIATFLLLSPASPKPPDIPVHLGPSLISSFVVPLLFIHYTMNVMDIY